MSFRMDDPRLDKNIRVDAEEEDPDYRAYLKNLHDIAWADDLPAALLERAQAAMRRDVVQHDSADAHRRMVERNRNAWKTR